MLVVVNFQLYWTLLALRVMHGLSSHQLLTFQYHEEDCEKEWSHIAYALNYFGYVLCPNFYEKEGRIPRQNGKGEESD
jgi:hypothetical protein